MTLLYSVLQQTRRHPQLARSLNFLYIGTETRRAWKEKLKLYGEVHQQNRACAPLLSQSPRPAWPAALGPVENAGGREKPGQRMGQKRRTVPEEFVLSDCSCTEALASEERVWILAYQFPS